MEISDASRNSNFGKGSLQCDTGHFFGNTWYRFVPPAGVKMEELFLGGDKCGTEYTGSLEGGHPEQVGEVVARTVVFGRILPKPDYNINIKVAKCNDGSTDYFVYRLPYVKEVNQCLRYCGSY